jgi:hypothetical protein
LTAIVELGAISSTYPSGAALATALAPMMVPAPGRFSTTKLLPSRCSSFCPSRRASMSVLPAGVNGTTMVTGCFG